MNWMRDKYIRDKESLLLNSLNKSMNFGLKKCLIINPGSTIFQQFYLEKINL